jgi:hypothetical protein
MIYLSPTIITPRVRPLRRLSDGGRTMGVCIARISSCATTRVISTIWYVTIATTIWTYIAWSRG